MLFRVDDGIGIRKGVGRGMVIGDNQIDIPFPAQLCRFVSIDPVIDRKDDIGINPFQNIARDTVSVGKTVWDDGT